MLAGFSKPTNKASPVPRRSPPPPPSSRETTRNPSPPLVTSGAGGGGVSPGAFWSTQHAKDSAIEDSSGPKFDEDTTSHSTLRDPCGPENHCSSQNSSPPEANIQTRGRRNAQVSSYKSEEVPSKDFEIRFFQEGSSHGTEKPKASKSESTSSFQNDAFNTFVAEFDTSKLSLGSNANKSTKEDELEAEIERLKEQLKQANLEKSEITSKFEKLSAICRSQRQEIQELKQAFAARTSSPNRDASKNQTATVLKSFAPSQVPSSRTSHLYTRGLDSKKFSINSFSRLFSSHNSMQKRWKPQFGSKENLIPLVKTLSHGRLSLMRPNNISLFPGMPPPSPSGPEMVITTNQAQKQLLALRRGVLELRVLQPPLLPAQAIRDPPSEAIIHSCLVSQRRLRASRLLNLLDGLVSDITYLVRFDPSFANFGCKR